PGRMVSARGQGSSERPLAACRYADENRAGKSAARVQSVPAWPARFDGSWAHHGAIREKIETEWISAPTKYSRRDLILISLEKETHTACICAELLRPQKTALDRLTMPEIPIRLERSDQGEYICQQFDIWLCAPKIIGVWRAFTD